MEELTDTPNMSVETKKNIPRNDANWVIQTKSIANSAPAPNRVGNAYAPSKKKRCQALAIFSLDAQTADRRNLKNIHATFRSQQMIFTTSESEFLICTAPNIGTPFETAEAWFLSTAGRDSFQRFSESSTKRTQVDDSSKHPAVRFISDSHPL